MLTILYINHSIPINTSIKQIELGLVMVEARFSTGWSKVQYWLGQNCSSYGHICLALYLFELRYGQYLLGHLLVADLFTFAVNHVDIMYVYYISLLCNRYILSSYSMHMYVFIYLSQKVKDVFCVSIVGRVNFQFRLSAVVCTLVYHRFGLSGSRCESQDWISAVCLSKTD